MSFASNMASQMGDSLLSFKNMLQYFSMQYSMGQSKDNLICDAENTINFLNECSRIKKMIKHFMSQQEIINKQYHSFLDRELKNAPIPGHYGARLPGSSSNWAISAESQAQLDSIRRDKERMAQELYPLNEDQEQLNTLLKQIKIRMQNTHAWYGGEQMTLWKLADIDQESGMQQHCYLQFSSAGQEL